MSSDLFNLRNLEKLCRLCFLNRFLASSDGTIPAWQITDCAECMGSGLFVALGRWLYETLHAWCFDLWLWSCVGC